MAQRWVTIRRLATLEDLRTVELLGLYERVFARLDPLAKKRIAQVASMNGWDRTWDDAPYAA